MTDVKRLERAIAKAMVDNGEAIRQVYAETRNKHLEDWHIQHGKYDGLLARRYARILAPRVTELLAGDR